MIRKVAFSGASVLALLIGSSIAMPVYAAQQGTQAAGDTPTEVIVVGTRKGLQKAVKVKRDSEQFVDSVIADDIGKLPDVNVAESLQRVSGVQIKRSLGEGTQVSIRGLTQNLTLVNGREVVDAAGRGGSGLDSLGTGSYGLLAQLPAEIIQRLDVTKLAAASDVEGAMGGTVNIITAKPLDSKTDLKAFSVEGLYNDREGKTGYRSSILLSHHFTDTFGGLLNISYSDRNITDESVFSFSGYLPLTSAFDTGATANHLGAGGTTISRDPNGDGTPGYYLADIRDTQILDQRKRLGINGSLQWRPSENSELWADVLYSKQNIDRDRHWLATNLSSVGNVYSSITFSPQETVLAGQLNSVVQGNTEKYTNDGTTLSGGLGGHWNGERLKVSGELNYAQSQQDAVQYFLRLQTKATYPVSFDFRNVDIPTWSLGGTALDPTNPAAFKFSNAFDNFLYDKSSETAAKVDLDYKLSTPFYSHLRAGVRVSRVAVSSATIGSQIGINVSADTLPDSYTVNTLNILKGATGYTPFAYLSPVLFGGGKTQACQVAVASCTPTLLPLQSYKTLEKDTAAYIQGDIDTTVFGIPVKGNTGVRYVETAFVGNGSRTSATSSSVILPVSVGKNYHDLLPSVSFKADLTDDLVARFGAAKVIARPNSPDQNPGLSLAVLSSLTPGAVPTGSAGNPALDPFRATQYDFALEYYFKPSSLLSAGLFSKDLASFIINKASYETYDSVSYLVTRPTNGAGGKVKGVELIYQDSLDFLPSPFNGLGFSANYSYIESTTPFVSSRTHEALPLPGLSKNNVNLILYYEKGDYGVRLAYNWRDKYLDSIGGGGDGLFYDTTQDLSLSGRWQFTKNLSVDAQFGNLLDSRVRQYGGFVDATKLYALNGRTFSLALRGKF